MRKPDILFGTLVVVGLGVVSACGGDEPLVYSDQVGINLKAKSSETIGGVVTNDKGITSETGDPYRVFVADATAALGGRDPSRIEIDSATLTLGGTSVGVTDLAQIFADRVEVVFVMNDTNNTYPAAHATSVGGTGPVPMAIDFDSTQLSAVDYGKLLDGAFKAVIRGDATADFPSMGAEADLQVTFTFEAFE